MPQGAFDEEKKFFHYTCTPSITQPVGISTPWNLQQQFVLYELNISIFYNYTNIKK